MRAVFQWMAVGLCGVVFGACVTGPNATANVPSSPSSPAPSSIRYEVEVDPTLSVLRVALCFEGQPPASLRPISSDGRGFLVSAVDQRGRALRTRDGIIDLAALGGDRCLAYTVDLALAVRRLPMAHRLPDAIVLSHAVWLWTPSAPPPRAELSFLLPRGVSVATPWLRLARSTPLRSSDEGGPPTSRVESYLLDESAFRFHAPVAFGALEEHLFSVGETEVTAVVLPGRLSLDAADLQHCLGTTMQAIGELVGGFPTPRLQVYVMPVGGEDPVAFGIVHRGGGASVFLMIRQDATAEEVLTHWVLVHEMMHLTLPMVRSEDAWLTEGLATYYQEVLLARMGHQSSADTWSRLREGLARGAAATARAPAQTLADATLSMHATRGYDRVYWSGTAFALELDIALRLQGRSLDDVLRAMPRAIVRSSRMLSGEELAQAMDATVGGQTVITLYRQYRDRRDFPSVDRLLRPLGVRTAAVADAVELVDAERSALRDAILVPAPPQGMLRPEGG